MLAPTIPATFYIFCGHGREDRNTDNAKEDTKSMYQTMYKTSCLRAERLSIFYYYSLYYFNSRIIGKGKIFAAYIFSECPLISI
jgi:hypothetical protein